MSTVWKLAGAWVAISLARGTLTWARARWAAKKPKRADWQRSVEDTLFWPVSMFSAKHSHSKRLSQLRVVDGVMAYGFLAHWPPTWTPSAVAALVAILVVVPLDAVLARAPLHEVLVMLQAVAVAAVGKIARRLGGGSSSGDDDGGIPVARDVPEES